MIIKVPAPLMPLYEQGLLEGSVRPLMSGKEADVYLVHSRGIQAVAKVYKDAENRTFRQRSDYSEGRHVRGSRQKRAMQRGSAYGKSLLEAHWQNAEVDALHRLYEAGVRVPVPYHHAENVLLMELVSDANGNPAPRLDDMHLSESDALLVHEILIRDVVRMLCAGLVHGDLSQYNILMAADGPVIIDLPQATDAAANNSSERLFLRDVRNLAHFLGREAPSLLQTQYGPEIWDLYCRAKLHPESELSGKFKAKARRVDTAGVIAEIQEVAAEAEAEMRPLSAYQLKKKRRAEEARATAAAEERRKAEEAKRPRAKPAKPAKRADAKKRPAERPNGAAVASPAGDGRPGESGSEPREGARRKRRRRRNRRRSPASSSGAPRSR